LVAVTVGGGGFGAVVVGTVAVGTVVVGTVTVGVVVVTTGPVSVTTGEVSVTPPPPGVVVTVVSVVSVTGAVAVVSVVSVSVTVVTTPAAKPDAAHTPRISSAINATAARVPRKSMEDIVPRWPTDMPRLGDFFGGFCGNRHENCVAGTSRRPVPPGLRQRGELVHLLLDLIDDVAGAWDSLGPTDARLAGS
jgi:hypothetical protein